MPFTLIIAKNGCDCQTRRWIYKFTAVFTLILPGLAVFAQDAMTWQAQSWSQAFNYESAVQDIRYTRAEKADGTWNICIAYPHLKDAYWLNVNYGMVEEANHLGINFILVEAGGYPNLERQREQILECTKQGTDALILGTVSFEGLEEEVIAISRRMPVLATVNDISDPGITAKAGVSWTEMGRVTGEFLSSRHPPGSANVKVAWFPGPFGAGWVDFIDRGFKEGIRNSSVEVVVTKWGDTGKEIQRTLVQEALESNQDIDYIVGNALTAEAAISILRQLGKEEQIGIVSTYLTPAVYRGIRRGRILAAPTDAPVLQGRISINQAVRVLEGRPYTKHAGPRIRIINGENYNSELVNESLAPPTFLPSFVVKH
jgi:protein TorT